MVDGFVHVRHAEHQGEADVPAELLDHYEARCWELYDPPPAKAEGGFVAPTAGLEREGAEAFIPADTGTELDDAGDGDEEE